MPNEILDNDSNGVIKLLFARKSLLSIAIQIEGFLDGMNLYVYKNWFKGKIVAGPKLSRYWVKILLSYEHNEMPDPAGGVVLQNLGVKVKYKKATENRPVKVKSPSDFEPGTVRPRLAPNKVWLVELTIPRKFVDESELEDLDSIDDEINVEDVGDAADIGLETSAMNDEQTTNIMNNSETGF